MTFLRAPINKTALRTTGHEGRALTWTARNGYYPDPRF